MFKPVFEGVYFSYFYESETEQYMLYWSEYGLNIILKDDDAFKFQKHIELISNQQDNTLNERIERTIKIYFYFRYAHPMPHFQE